jgi:transcriptional regulator GlxA family with amidase domain
MTELETSRRRFNEGVAAFTAMVLGGAFETAPAAAEEKSPPRPSHDMSQMPAHWRGSEKVVMLVYPGFTALDIVGPQYMFASMMGAKTYIVAKTKDPVRSDTGLVFTPAMDFSEAPRDVDIFCVGGGTRGTVNAIKDEETLKFVREVGGGAKYVTSVCTGSMILGAAGLLDGYKATSHWLAKRLLPAFGAIVTDGRFARDRNRITAGGVTAGIDFGLGLIAQLRDDRYAQGVQLLAEYAPAPPFEGDPARAHPEVREHLEHMMWTFNDELGEAAKAAFLRSKA